jgi:hypothetical protein
MLRRLALVLLSLRCLAQEPEAGDAKFGTTVVISSGLRGQIYFLPQNTLVLPKFEKLEPVGTIYTSSLNISPREFSEGFPGVTNRIEWFAIVYTGRFYIDKPGKYRFAVASDDGSSSSSTARK